MQYLRVERDQRARRCGKGELGISISGNQVRHIELQRTATIAALNPLLTLAVEEYHDGHLSLSNALRLFACVVTVTVEVEEVPFVVTKELKIAQPFYCHAKMLRNVRN